MQIEKVKAFQVLKQNSDLKLNIPCQNYHSTQPGFRGMNCRLHGKSQILIQFLKLKKRQGNGSGLKTKLKQEGSELYEKIVQLKMTAPGSMGRPQKSK